MKPKFSGNNSLIEASKWLEFEEDLRTLTLDPYRLWLEWPIYTNKSGTQVRVAIFTEKPHQNLQGNIYGGTAKGNF